MLSKEAFVDFILSGESASPFETAGGAALPPGIDGFDTSSASSQPSDSFARRLLEASGFGLAQLVQKDNVIRSSDAVAHYLPERVCFWPKTASRPYQTLLFEAELDHKQLLDIPAFKGRKISHLDMVEDALARFVSEALDGFQRGGEGVTADVRKGRKEETLCVVSIVDKREGQQVHLVCFGTQNEKTGGLETFQITEQTKLWEPHIAREHLSLLYERQFKKLENKDWQEAFTTTEERRQAEKLLEVCTQEAPNEHAIQEGVIDLLDIIAKGFGLRKKPKAERRLQAFALPADHDIGMDPDELESGFGGQNPFGGVTLKDERSRLLGYIIYPFKTKTDAAKLRKHLKDNNRFHNVLVIYPDKDQASLELWQGGEQLTGKLRKGHGYKDAADVVNLLSRFFVVSKANVKNPNELAEELAYRARYLRRLALKQLKEESISGPLRNLYNGFKESLVHDQTEEEFADAFAQTLTYSLLTARWVMSAQGAQVSDRFTRKAAMQRLSIGSRFLSEMFSSMEIAALDEQRARLLWLEDDIADLLDRIDVAAIFSHDESDLSADPIIHFYEPFLKEYDASVRMQRGVYYTPRPVVSYIVRSVDELLRTVFLLEDGLADTTSWGEMVKRHQDLQIPEGVDSELPFVQILDPATGTGTFLVEAIDLIHTRCLEKWKAQGKDEKDLVAQWNDYVPKHLLPRLYGYELLMAPYAIAHLKIGLKLYETGYRFASEERARIYLTNSLEPALDFAGRFEFAIPALAHEAQAVNEIKSNHRFTVVIGNPPYAGHSFNKGEWITSLVRDYYQLNGQPLGEANPKYLLDDYVKFIRFATYQLQRSQRGILGFITNNGFLDNPTFRGMRQQLLLFYSQGGFVNLHGSLKKKETSPDGTPDENVFDIQQGVAISILATGSNSIPSLLKYLDLWGARTEKFCQLANNTYCLSVDGQVLQPTTPYFNLIPDRGTNSQAYLSNGILLTDVFIKTTTGVKTHRDHFAYAFDRADLLARIERLKDRRVPDETIRLEFELKDTRDWHLITAREALRIENTSDWISHALYRPFDIRHYYASGSIVELPRLEVMSSLLGRENLALGVGRQGLAVAEDQWDLVTVAAMPVDTNVFRRGGVQVFPLWIHDNTHLFSGVKSINFRPEFLKSARDCLGIIPSPTDLFGFIYAQLHSPGYREMFAQLLAIDFPRILIPRQESLFSLLAELGSELISLHLMKEPRLEQFITTYVGTTAPVVRRISWSEDVIWVDASTSQNNPNGSGTNGFRGVPREVWDFHIGGNQVCDKWLKDRKGRTLSPEDIEHYQKIIVAINDTIRIMQEIDQVIEKHGGWPGAFIRESVGVTNA